VSERALVLALVTALEASQTRRWHGERHYEHCQRGLWWGRWAFGDGAPCSPKCLAAQQALAAGRAYLEATEIRQMALEAS
jgi:hypothetical protein